MAIYRKELTIQEVAELAKCSRRRVIRALCAGKLRGRKVGTEGLIWIEDARAFARVQAKRQVQP